MDDQRTAFVFAHPAAHELLVAGLMQRACGDVLFVTQADSGALGSSDIARHCFESLEISRSFEFLEMSEVESYTRAFKGDFEFYREYRNRILDWLHRIQPDVIFGDALELTNFHHDLTRMLLDDAIREYRKTNAVVNYEIAIACRTSDDLRSFRTQEFPNGHSESYQPTPEEIHVKEQMLELIAQLKPLIRMGPQFYSMEREVYRPVQFNRDYALPPTEFKRHYDDWGREMVRRGKYEQALLFDQHFAPIARYLQTVDNDSAVQRRAA